MEKNKPKQQGLKEQVHSEFETSTGSHYDAVRDETLAKQRQDAEGPLNQLPEDEAAKKDQQAGEEPGEKS